MLPRAVAAATAPASAQAGGNERVSRLPCAGTVQAVCCLPRAPLALAGGSRAFAAASAAATGVATAGSMGSLDANLHAVHATSHGTNHALLSLRSLLTPAQVERLRRAQQEAAEEAADAALAAGVACAPPPPLTSAVDPAPVVATLELRGCGGVGRLACLSDRLLVAATNLGEVVMVEVASSSDDQAGMGASVAATPLQRRARPAAAAASASSKTALQLRAVHTFTDLHPNSGSSSALATHLSSSTPLLASVSDDGSLALMAPFTRQVLRRVPHAHPSALFSATFGLGGCLHTAGMGGTISTFDLRAGGGTGGGFSVQGLSKPSSLLFDANAVSITSLAVHPTRPHLLATGSSNGSLSIFDVRRSSSSSSSSLLASSSSAVTPLCSIQAQKAAVLDLAFLPWAPQQLLSCSDDGSLCCFHFGAGGGGGDTSSGDEAFLASAVQQSMRPSKLVQNTSAIRALAIDREARTVLAATDAPSLLSCVL